MDDVRQRPVREYNRQRESGMTGWKFAFVAFFLLLAMTLILSRARDLAPVMIAIGLIMCAFYLERVSRSLAELVEIQRNQSEAKVDSKISDE